MNEHKQVKEMKNKKYIIIGKGCKVMLLIK